MIAKGFKILIDAGHGGIINGQYVTPGKRFTHENGPTVYEGVFNRQIQAKLAYLLKGANIPFEILVPENEDIKLKERGERINKAHDENDGKTWTLSLHGNAGGGSGFEVFTSKGQTDSDAIAEIFVEEMEKYFPTQKMRVDITDGDKDKEKNFTILMNKGAAILCEAFFMDRIEDARLMTSDEGQSKIALAYFAACKRVHEIGAKPLKATPKAKAAPKAEAKAKTTEAKAKTTRTKTT